MTEQTDFIAQARQASEAERQSLEREIALDRTSLFFSRRGHGAKHALLEMLVDMMSHFWMALFPILLVGGIIVFAVAQAFGISIWGAITLIAVVAAVLLTIGQGLR